MPRSMMRAVRTIGLTAALVVGSVATPSASGQISREDPSSVAAKRQNIAKMLVEVRDVELVDTPLEDVVEFIERFTDADLEPRWVTDRHPIGLEPDTPVTLNFRRGSALDLLERVLAEADDSTGFASASTWQMTPYGSIEFGPRERLNARKQLVIYDIRDLLFVVPDAEDPPDFDLNSIFSQGGEGGGGGGQSPFQGQAQDREPEDREQAAEFLIELLQRFVERNEWESAGGDGGTMDYYRGTLLVNAADYIHRQLDGYRWWPGSGVRTETVDGQRRVSITADGVDLEAMRRGLEPGRAGR